jgi:hypothetical protein
VFALLVLDLFADQYQLYHGLLPPPTSQNLFVPALELSRQMVDGHQIARRMTGSRRHLRASLLNLETQHGIH